VNNIRFLVKVKGYMLPVTLERIKLTFL